MYRRRDRRKQLPLLGFVLGMGVLLSFLFHWIFLIGSDAVITHLVQTGVIGAQNFFYSRILVPNGTDPTADADGDIISFLEFDGTVGISGSNSSVTGSDAISWFVRRNTLYYHSIWDEGVSLPQTGALNFTGAGITCTDGGGSTDCDVPSSADGVGYDTIQDEGTGLTQRGTVNFTGAGVTCADDAGNVRTNCDIPGGGSGDAFTTVEAPFGTNPTAEGSDTLVITSSNTTILITGNSVEDSLDFTVNPSLIFSQHGLGLGQTGEIATTSDVNNIRVPIHTSFTIKDVACRVRVAPTGADVIVDAFKNGTTIFTTSANRPTILDGELVDVSAEPDVTDLVSGDFFNIQIIQVGSSTPGEDLVCVTRLRQVLYDTG